MAEKKEKCSLVCNECGDSFLVHEYRKNKARSCGRSCYASWKSKQPPWNKGIANTWYNPKGLKRGHGWNKGQKRYWESASEFKKGTVPWNYQGKSSKNKLDRYKFGKEILGIVLERDNHTCQMCAVIGGYLHVDHIQPFAEYIEGRFSIDNCRTLCRSCHYKVTFGKEMPLNSKWGLKPRKDVYGGL